MRREKPKKQNPEKERKKIRNEKLADRSENRSQFGNNTSAKSLQSAEIPTVFGISPVLEILKADARRIEKIFVAEESHEKRIGEILTLAKEKRIPFQKIPRRNFSKYVEQGANHQGVFALKSSADYYDAEKLSEEIFAKSRTAEKPLAIILDGLEDPRNLGAILRTADCVGADGVFIPERRAVGLTDTVAKTSAGAVVYVKTAKVVNIGNLIDKLKEQNIWTVGASADAKMDYTDWDWRQSSALVLGNEGKGLHRLTAEKCDVLVKIPLRGKIESLNVSVAAGVILYEAVRQRNSEKTEKDSEEEI